jgi:hypothetical protein
MTNYPYLLFNKDPEQLRRIGARGGKAFGRNERARRALRPPPAAIPPRAVRHETTRRAIARLDTQCPWLRSAERRSDRGGAAKDAGRDQRAA